VVELIGTAVDDKNRLMIVTELMSVSGHHSTNLSVQQKRSKVLFDGPLLLFVHILRRVATYLKR
jgi:hypothetical protein